MDRYGVLTARWYDLLSGEPVYRVGRRLGVAALDLRAGERVLDLGCGTGLNLPTLLHAVGDGGLVVRLDRSPAMLEAARAKVAARDFPQLRLVQGDATDPDALTRAAAARGGVVPFDAVIATYTLSLIPDAHAVCGALAGVLAPAARVAVVDMARPPGRWAWATPLARTACWLGGADIDAHPWEALEPHMSATRAWSRRGGHVQVRVGSR